MTRLLIESENVAARQRRVQSSLKVAYLASRFPKITETFVLYEALAVGREGVQVDFYALQREHTSVMHPEARALLPQVRFAPWFSFGMLSAHLCYLFSKPLTYVSTFFALLCANFGSARYFAAAVAFFPKTVYFARRMQSDGVKHIHAHFASHPAAMAWVIHRLTGISYSFTAHGSDLHREKRMLSKKVADAEFVVAVSNYNRRIITDHCGYSVKVYVIHCGVEAELFRAPSKTAAAESADVRFSVTCIGTLHEVKGQRFLIEACRLLAERGEEIVCHFVGDGPDERALRRQAQNAGIGDRVVFHGRKTRAEVARILASVDVVAAPSVPTSDGRREGVPVALMEAMSSGRAVVASRLSGIPELVRDNETGLLVPPGDAVALADALSRLSHDPILRRRLAEAGRRLVEQEFDQERNARRLARRFLELRNGSIRK